LGFKYELDFGLDNFQQPKVLSAKDSIAQIILNLFMMRPGSMPSLPHIGINIEKYLYMLEEDVDLDGLKQDIFRQCTDLLSFMSFGDIQTFFAPYQGQSMLVIILPIQGLDAEDEVLLMGFKKDQNNGLLFNYQFEQGQIFN
jgi:hypothetical protein